jgi:hypothetical protein
VEGIVLYVSTEGNDAWSGHLPDPTVGRQDGPFRTIQRARDAIRELKARGKFKLRGQDAHSLIEDPLFIAPDLDDFRLKDDSPALKLGFKPFDFTQAGPRG